MSPSSDWYQHLPPRRHKFASWTLHLWSYRYWKKTYFYYISVLPHRNWAPLHCLFKWHLVNIACSYEALFHLGTSQESTHTARLQGRSIFKDIRAEAEEEIHEKLISKMNEFIELSNYDWLISEPQGTSSSWLMDLVTWIEISELPNHFFYQEHRFV